MDAYVGRRRWGMAYGTHPMVEAVMALAKDIVAGIMGT
jgi:hypothetical protein